MCELLIAGVPRATWNSFRCMAVYRLAIYFLYGAAALLRSTALRLLAMRERDLVRTGICRQPRCGRLREKLAHDRIMVDPDAGIDALRHRFLNEAGEHTDVLTLQYIAGHDTIKTTMR